jgi:hypothetical protein
MVRKRLRETEVLCYTTKLRAQKTVRRFYMKWRQSQDIPERCDNPQCMFHNAALEWNRYPLMLILDHVSGNRRDNSAKNLRLLCPNCASQLPTQGGRNKGRIQNQSQQGYEVVHRDGKRDANVFLGVVSSTASVGQADVNGPSEENET